MKKLVAILLLSIYTIAAFGVETASFYCCGQDNSVATVSASPLNGRTQLASNDDERCGNQHKGIVFQHHHIANSSAHDPLRHFFSTIHTPGITSFAQVATQHQAIRKITTAYYIVQPSAVPAYVFNCVFRI